MTTTGLQNVTDKSIGWMNWFYTPTPAIQETVAQQAKLGFGVIGCPEYDVATIKDWLSALKKAGKAGLGVIDTDWSRTLEGLEPTASLAWNAANTTVVE